MVSTVNLMFKIMFLVSIWSSSFQKEIQQLLLDKIALLYAHSWFCQELTNEKDEIQLTFPISAG